MDTKSDGEDAAPDFMTAAEVAAWFRIGVSTVYAWASSERIPFLRFNGVVRFSRQQLTRWMQQHTRGPSLSSDQVSERAQRGSPAPTDSPHHGGRGSSCEETPHPVQEPDPSR